LERQGEDWLLAVVTRDRLKRLLERMFDRQEFLSDYGIRSLSRYHQEHPYRLRLGGQDFEVGYEPGESQTPLFGGNSNWRGPIWFPINFLLIEALEEYHRFYGNRLKVPSLEGAGKVSLAVAADQIRRRLCRLFLEQTPGPRYFHEYFHAESGRGLGATHQTGWTALVATFLEELG
jgi:hypothetical protein